MAVAAAASFICFTETGLCKQFVNAS